MIYANLWAIGIGLGTVFDLVRDLVRNTVKNLRSELACR
jgi:hypothetical protein